MSDQESRCAEIRRLNDQLRTTFNGGMIVMTRGVVALDEATRAEIVAAVAKFDGFDESNDAHKESPSAGGRLVL
jgi:hypothetical protein